jgi:hypothetical protein
MSAGLIRVSPLYGLLALGCGTADDSVYDPPILVVERVPITEDVGLELELGTGAGLFLEVDNAGGWQVTTTCDTELTDYACDWDIVLSVEPGNELSRLRALDLELWDELSRVDEGAIYLRWLTDTDFDAVTFNAPTDAALMVDALLDGREAPRYLFWNARGAVQAGAPSNPVELVPEAD